MAAEPAVTLCIINHDGADHLRAALAAILNQNFGFDEILLVDNGSQDNSIAVASELYPSIRVLALPDNLGPGGGRNAGYTHARNNLILFQDNDIALEPDAASLLLARLVISEGALAVAPRVLYAADPAIVQFDSADCHFLGLMATRNADRALAELDEQPATTSSLVTACFLFDRSRWQGGSPFDESLGFNLEDHDFAVRARLKGHMLWIEPRARVRHGSGTPGLSYRPGGNPSRKRLFYLTLNRWIVITKCYSARTLMLLSPALLLYELMQLAWLAGQGHLSIWTDAARAYLRKLRMLLELRSATQRQRTLGDAAVLREAPLPMTLHVRAGFAGRWLAPCADLVLRGYWRLVRGWI